MEKDSMFHDHVQFDTMDYRSEGDERRVSMSL